MSQQIGKLYPLYSIVWQAAEENEHTILANKQHSNRKHCQLKLGWGMEERIGSIAKLKMF